MGKTAEIEVVPKVELPPPPEPHGLPEDVIIFEERLKHPSERPVSKMALFGVLCVMAAEGEVVDVKGDRASIVSAWTGMKAKSATIVRRIFFIGVFEVSATRRKAL